MRRRCSISSTDHPIPASAVVIAAARPFRDLTSATATSRRAAPVEVLAAHLLDELLDAGLVAARRAIVGSDAVAARSRVIAASRCDARAERRLDVAGVAALRGRRVRLAHVGSCARSSRRCRVSRVLREEVDRAARCRAAGRCGARGRCAGRASPDSRGCRSGRPSPRAAGSVPRRPCRWRRRRRSRPVRKACSTASRERSREVTRPQPSDRLVQVARGGGGAGEDQHRLARCATSSTSSRAASRTASRARAATQRVDARDLFADRVRIGVARRREQFPEEHLLERVAVLLVRERARGSRASAACGRRRSQPARARRSAAGGAATR